MSLLGNGYLLAAFWAAGALALTGAASAQQGKKAILGGNSPAWVMAGTTTPVRIMGTDLGTIKEVRFKEPGFTAKFLKAGPNQPKNDDEKKQGGTQVEAEVTIPADARPGLHLFELVREDGTSLPGRMLVDVAAPEIAEKEPNGSLRQPQELPAGNVTVNGKLDGDGADVFRLNAKTGERWRIEVFVRRQTGGGKFEAVMRLRDPQLAPVKAAVDQGWDCALEHTCTADGPYLLELFDGDNRSGGDYNYRLTFRKL